MDSSPANRSKEEWRQQFREYRRSLSEEAYRAWSALIGQRTLAHPSVVDASIVHVYWPQVDRGEVDTRPLITALRANDVTVVLPVVTSYDPKHRSMEQRVYEGRRSLTANRWGIPEPVDGPLVPPQDTDVLLVPALGASRTGARIGQGAGYYDAFLASVEAPRIGLVYDACVVPSVPTDSHDVPLSTIITERRSIAGTASSRRPSSD